MSLGSEFKEFAMKGNVIDLAVGVVIGAAFGKIVASLVADIVMPPLGARDRQCQFHRPRRCHRARPEGQGSAVALWRVHPDHLRVPDHCAGALPHHQGHQPAQTAAAAAVAGSAAADSHRAAIARDSRRAGEASLRSSTLEPTSTPARSNASRVRFSQPVSVIATLSSMRMPPNLRRLATRDQLILRPRPSARAASNS